MPLRILIADDHGLLRAGLRSLLSAEPDMQVVGEAGDGNAALQEAARLRPDVLLLDINMPDPGGIEVTRRLRQIAPETRILILTAFEDESLLRQAIQYGASGYIVKRAIEAELVAAVRTVACGELYVHPTMTRLLLQNPAPAAPDGDETALNTLTPREIDVLRLIAMGYTNRETAERLCISVRTVETHRANVMGKLELQGRAELMRYAKENGFLD